MHLDEAGAVEGAVGALEGRIVGNLLGERFAGDAESERAGLVVEGRIGDQPAEDLARNAEKLRLLGRHRLTELLGELALGQLVLAGELSLHGISVPPTVAMVSDRKPLKMSETPQMAKPTTSRAMKSWASHPPAPLRSASKHREFLTIWRPRSPRAAP